MGKHPSSAKGVAETHLHALSIPCLLPARDTVSSISLHHFLN